MDFAYRKCFSSLDSELVEAILSSSEKKAQQFWLPGTECADLKLPTPSGFLSVISPNIAQAPTDSDADFRIPFFKSGNLRHTFQGLDSPYPATFFWI